MTDAIPEQVNFLASFADEFPDDILPYEIMTSGEISNLDALVFLARLGIDGLLGNPPPVIINDAEGLERLRDRLRDFAERAGMYVHPDDLEVD